MTSSRPRRPCVQCARPTKTADQVCRTCAPITAKRPERPCHGCGRITTAKSQVCPTCAPAVPGAQPYARHALTGGQWVTVRGVQRWQPTTLTPKKAA